jgi:hypothetical protein
MTKKAKSVIQPLVRDANVLRGRAGVLGLKPLCAGFFLQQPGKAGRKPAK